MRILVTGAAGFVGRHAVRELVRRGHEVAAFDHAPPGQPLATETEITGDLGDAASVLQAVASTRPEGCLHLGAMSFVPEGWTHPHAMFRVNVLGTIHLLEALRAVAPAARALAVTTAQVYGSGSRPAPIRETEPLQPDTMYGISKAAADHACLAYARHHGMPVMVARPHNHIGPGQSPEFAVPSFVRQLSAIRNGASPPVLKVGNLASARDFTDVRDVVRAYAMLIENAMPARAYNVASGRCVTMAEILDILCRLAGVTPRIEQEQSRYRPEEHSPLLDTERIETEIGWRPEIPLQKTLADICQFP